MRRFAATLTVFFLPNLAAFLWSLYNINKDDKETHSEEYPKLSHPNIFASIFNPRLGS